jgi:hypothetical protein
MICAISVIYGLHFFMARTAAGGAEKYAEIVVDGQVVESVSLGSDGLYSPPGLPSVQISIRDGAIGFVSSDCPDKTCIHSGFLSIPGQVAACLPNRLAVRVGSRAAMELDTVIY